MNDYRENYFNPPHEDSPAEYKTGGDNYNSDLDRATEQEMVPDIVERLTTRYEIDYNNRTSNSYLAHSLRKIFKIPGLNNIRLIKLLKHLFALLPRNAYDGNINDVDVVVIPIIAGDTSLAFSLRSNKDEYPIIVRAYLASSMIDMTPNYSNNGSGGLIAKNNASAPETTFTFNPTIPFKQDDELIVYYK